MLVVPIEWAPLIIIIIIICYACQLIAASAKNEVADGERRDLKQQVEGKATTRRFVPSSVQDFVPYSNENATIFDRYERQSRFPNGKVCSNCDKRFMPIANESGFYKCPFCGKAFIL